jgi:hypothetical protein
VAANASLGSGGEDFQVSTYGLSVGDERELGKCFHLYTAVEEGRGEAGLHLDARECRVSCSDPLASMGAGIYQIDPLGDPRWSEFVAHHPRSSFYHSQPWLESLKRTYGYRPVAYTTSPPGCELRNGLVFCRIESWLTGRRIVSLPFSDHCDPLVGSDGEFAKVITDLLQVFQKEHWEYTELRPRTTIGHLSLGLAPGKQYCFHFLDLSSGVKELYSSLHKDCIQRKIRRADREGLEYREGRSRALLAIFYRLFVKMRQRHGLPPQPFAWFVNLAECLGPAMQVRIALHRGRPAASILTVVYRDTMTYKYGCSDPDLTKFGGTPWLFWKVILEAKSTGLRELDLGRSDWKNPGLITFKDRLGAKRVPVTYWRFPKAQGVADALPAGRLQRLAGEMFLHMPAPLLSATGRLLYRHFG